MKTLGGMIISTDFLDELSDGFYDSTGLSWVGDDKPSPCWEEKKRFRFFWVEDKVCIIWPTLNFVDTLAERCCTSFQILWFWMPAQTCAISPLVTCCICFGIHVAKEDIKKSRAENTSLRNTVCHRKGWRFYVVDLDAQYGSSSLFWCLSLKSLRIPRHQKFFFKFFKKKQRCQMWL